MSAHYHAVVWIDHSRARVFHFGVDEAARVVVRPEHSVRDIHRGDKRTGHRIAEDHKYFDAVIAALADAGAILIVGPAGEKHELAKYIAERRPELKTRIEGVESLDHPTDGELLAFARHYVKAADRMRSQT